MKKRLAVLMLAMATLFVGCGNQQAENVENVENQIEVAKSVTSDEKWSLEIEHAFGSTVIESKPERIVTLGWGNSDTPLALGVAPVGVSMANYGHEELLLDEERFVTEVTRVCM